MCEEEDGRRAGRQGDWEIGREKREGREKRHAGARKKKEIGREKEADGMKEMRQSGRDGKKL